MLTLNSFPMHLASSFTDQMSGSVGASAPHKHQTATAL